MRGGSGRADGRTHHYVERLNLHLAWLVDALVFHLPLTLGRPSHSDPVIIVDPFNNRDRDLCSLVEFAT